MQLFHQSLRDEWIWIADSCFLLLGCPCFSVCFYSSYPGHLSPSLTQPGQSECCVCVLHTGHMPHNPVYMQTSGKGWVGASRCCQASSCTYLCPFLWELIRNVLHYWVTSLLAVLVVSHSSVAEENKQKFFIIRHTCNRSSHHFYISQWIFAVVEGALEAPFSESIPRWEVSLTWKKLCFRDW